MPTRPTLPQLSTLSGRTVDIINTIRQYGSQAMKEATPEILKDANGDLIQSQIREFGDVLQGYPAIANEFLGSLMNRIARVRVDSISFNNLFAEFKKGYLDYGEVVEEIFVQIAAVRDFRPEQSAKREFARTPPDVRAAFHAINWEVQYATTIQRKELVRAFTSADGVASFIERIVGQLVRAREVDEFMLFKYLIARGILDGKAKALALPDDYSIKDFARTVRANATRMQFPSREYNAAGVLNTVDPSNLAIVVDAETHAEMDVDLLSAAFNMDRARLEQRTFVFDAWDTIDFDRFSDVNNGDYIKPFTAEELEVLNSVRGFVADVDWFQVYDNYTQMTDTNVGSGNYINYWYTVAQTWSTSPFANAIVIMDDTTFDDAPATLNVVVEQAIEGPDSTIAIFSNPEEPTQPWFWKQTDELGTAGVAVKPYGAVIIPSQIDEGQLFTLEVETAGVTYYAQLEGDAVNKGLTLEFTKTPPAPPAGDAQAKVAVQQAPASPTGAKAEKDTASK